MQVYGFKFIQLPRYTLKMVPNMRRRIGLYIDGLNVGLKKEMRGAIIVNDMHIGRLMTYV